MAYKPKWRKVIKWVLENFNEPVWADCNTFNNTFDMTNDGSRKDKMTFYFLITKQAGYKVNPQAKDISSRFEGWYRSNRDYLPTDLRDAFSTNSHGVIDHVQTEESRNLLQAFNEWFDTMLEKVEMDLTQRFVTGGAKRYLDVLERRFRSNWGMNKETTIETKKNTDSEELVIKFTEA